MSYGSLINRMYDQQGEAPVQVGMGATILMWSDRRAGTIIEVQRFRSGPNAGKPRIIIVQEDNAKRTDKLGMSDSQSYEYEPNPNGIKHRFNARKDGTFKGLLIGRREEYYDYSF